MRKGYCKTSVEGIVRATATIQRQDAKELHETSSYYLFLFYTRAQIIQHKLLSRNKNWTKFTQLYTTHLILQVQYTKYYFKFKLTKNHYPLLYFKNVIFLQSYRALSDEGRNVRPRHSLVCSGSLLNSGWVFRLVHWDWGSNRPSGWIFYVHICFYWHFFVFKLCNFIFLLQLF